MAFGAASEPTRCRRAQQWPQSSLSCFELFRAPRGRRARGAARAAARGPHRCKERARARTPIARERARREPGRSLLRWREGSTPSARRRPHNTSARWRKHTLRAPTLRTRESAHANPRRAPRPAAAGSAPTRTRNSRGSIIWMTRSSARARSRGSSSRRPTKARKLR